MTAIELPLFVHWEKTLRDILSRTEKFPKRIRFTLSSRIDLLAIEILEKIVEARYAKDKSTALLQASLSLEKLRVLVRITHEDRHLDFKGYEYISRNINEAGRMLGGWIRSRNAK